MTGPQLLQTLIITILKEITFLCLFSSLQLRLTQNMDFFLGVNCLWKGLFFTTFSSSSLWTIFHF